MKHKRADDEEQLRVGGPVNISRLTRVSLLFRGLPVTPSEGHPCVS